MLISYPILGNQVQNEEARLQAALSIENASSGRFPVSTVAPFNLWHGGIHIDGGADPIRAIADGTIVACRFAQQRENYPGQGEYDTGFVLIRHDTKAGDNTTVVFYSLYMHLACRNDLSNEQYDRLPDIFRTGGFVPGPQTIVPPPDLPQSKIWRRDILGFTGLAYDRRLFHFEIFTTPDAFSGKGGFWRDCTRANYEPSPDFFGDTHFVIPRQQSFASRHPRAENNAPHRIVLEGKNQAFPLTEGNAGQNTEELYVSIRMQHGQRFAATYRKDRQDRYVQFGSPVAQQGYEHELFRLASALYPDCPSAGFEWLRFGRVLSSDISQRRENWQLVRYSEAAIGYIDLAAAGVGKLSDADFPYWHGWTHIEEGGLASPSDAFIDEPSTLTLTQDQSVEGRTKLRHLAVTHPTEWNSEDLAIRFSRIRAAGQPLADSKAWQQFEAHVQKLAFWQHTGLPCSVVHFHPLQFIYHFRKCAWLSPHELAQCIPRQSLSGSVQWQTALSRATQHSGPVSRFLRKYLGPSTERIVHTLAQIHIETGLLRTTSEDGRGAGKLYGPFYGRGYHQLTWAGNYRKYGEFKGLPAQIQPSYYDPRITANSSHARDSNGELLRWAPCYDPEIVAQSPRHSADSSGFYWVTKTFRGTRNINRVCDLGVTPSEVGFISWLINGGGTGYANRQQFAKYLWNVLSCDPYLTGTVQFSYPPLSPPGNPKLCLTFPPAQIPYATHGEVNYVRQVP